MLSCFCEIWALCVSWINYDHLYYAPCLASWALFGSLVPVMCNRTSCVQVHELPQSHCGDNMFSSLIYCSVLCKIEWFNWIMVKIQLSFKHSEFYINCLIIFSLITTLSTDFKKSLQCKGIFLSNVNWRHAWR